MRNHTFELQKNEEEEGEDYNFSDFSHNKQSVHNVAFKDCNRLHQLE